MPELTVERDNGTATVTMAFGHGNRFDLARVRRLSAVVTPLLNDADVRILVLRSADPAGFSAGWLPTQDHETDADSLALAVAGQTLCQMIRDSACVSVAEITGECFGPGFELALACDVRMAESTPLTKIGFPDAAVGLLPGWGGVSRLVQILGPTAAMRWLNNPKLLNAREAYRCGLVTHEHSARRTRIERRAVVDRINRRPRKVGEPLWLRRATNGRQLKSIVPIHESIYATTVRSLVESAKRSPGEGRAAERTWFARSRASAAVKSHFAIEHSMGSGPRLPVCPSLPIPAFPHVVAVSGADDLHARLAVLSAVRGSRLLVSSDVQPVIENQLQQLKRNGIVVAADLDAIRQRVQLSEIDFGRAEWLMTTPATLIEAESVASPRCLVSVASELVEPFQSLVTRPGRLVGLRHEPVWQMPGDRPFVEIAIGPETSADAAATAHRWLTTLGDRAVVGGDRHGLTVRRVASAYFDEAVRLTAEGISPQALDAAVRASGSPEGPFERMDRIGFEALMGGVRKLMPLVAAGMTGQGKGFYRRGLWGKRKENTPAQMLLWDRRMQTVEGFHGSPAAIDLLPPAQQLVVAIDRLGLRVLNEAVGCLHDDGVCGPAEIDLAITRGAGLLVGHGGPLRHCDQAGIRMLVLRMAAMAKLYGPRFEPHPELIRRATAEANFYDRTPEAELIYRQLAAA